MFRELLTSTCKLESTWTMIETIHLLLTIQHLKATFFLVLKYLALKYNKPLLLEQVIVIFQKNLG